jgi:CBS domain-containing protein
MSELTMTVGAVLEQKARQIWSTTPDTTVYECVKMMAEKQVGALLVMDGTSLVGIISERDYARKLVLQGRSSKTTPVADVMSHPVFSVTRQHTIGDCMYIITKNHIRHLPVLENDAVVGVVSIGDLVNCVMKEQENTIRHLTAYICGTSA